MYDSKCLVRVLINAEHEYLKSKVRKPTRTIHYIKSTMLSHAWVQGTDVNNKMKSFSTQITTEFYDWITQNVVFNWLLPFFLISFLLMCCYMKQRWTSPNNLFNSSKSQYIHLNKNKTTWLGHNYPSVVMIRPRNVLSRTPTSGDIDFYIDCPQLCNVQ